MAVQCVRRHGEVERHLGLESCRAEGVEQVLAQIEVVLDEGGGEGSGHRGGAGAGGVPPRTTGGRAAHRIVARTVDSARRSPARTRRLGPMRETRAPSPATRIEHDGRDQQRRRRRDGARPLSMATWKRPSWPSPRARHRGRGLGGVGRSASTPDASSASMSAFDGEDVARSHLLADGRRSGPPRRGARVAARSPTASPPAARPVERSSSVTARLLPSTRPLPSGRPCSRRAASASSWPSAWVTRCAPSSRARCSSSAASRSRSSPAEGRDRGGDRLGGRPGILGRSDGWHRAAVREPQDLRRGESPLRGFSRPRLADGLPALIAQRLRGGGASDERGPRRSEAVPRSPPAGRRRSRRRITEVVTGDRAASRRARVRAPESPNPRRAVRPPGTSRSSRARRRVRRPRRSPG